MEQMTLKMAEIFSIVNIPISVCLATYFAWRFISCFMVFMKSLHSHSAFVTARAMQAHGYTTDAELTELKHMADSGGSVASSAVKWFTLMVFFVVCSIAGF
ncbi:hypothetical protein MYOV002v2_p0062 [Vibrio phage 144E46.1]|nr:hypothetical protein MYOV002v2_p0062 [Vibrio phage 144E46.1]